MSWSRRSPAVAMTPIRCGRSQDAVSSKNRSTNPPSATIAGALWQ